MRAACAPQDLRAPAGRPGVTPSRWPALSAPTPTAFNAHQRPIGLSDINDPFGDVSPSETGWAIRPQDPAWHTLLGESHATPEGVHAEGHLALAEGGLPKEEGQCGRGARLRACSR